MTTENQTTVKVDPAELGTKLTIPGVQLSPQSNYSWTFVRLEENSDEELMARFLGGAPMVAEGDVIELVVSKVEHADKSGAYGSAAPGVTVKIDLRPKARTAVVMTSSTAPTAGAATVGDEHEGQLP